MFLKSYCMLSSSDLILAGLTAGAAREARFSLLEED